MKIFNWVHRRFHRKGDHEVGHEAKKMELVKYENDKVALLKNGKLAHYVLDGWADSILTIGTLGFDPLEDLKKQEKDYYNYADVYEIEEERYCACEEYYCKDEIVAEDEEEEEEDKKDGEMDPLMLGASQHGYEHHDQLAKLIYDNDNNDSDEVDVKFKIDRDEDEEVGRKNIKGGQRITLADLFSAENDMEKKASGKGATKVIGVGYLKKATSTNVVAKHGASLSKKIISGVKQDSRPMKKLQKLMTKMLRRKIHPDIEGKVRKENELEATNKAQVVNGGGNGVAESVSLLQTRVAVV